MSSVVYPVLMDLENINSDDLLCLLTFAHYISNFIHPPDLKRKTFENSKLTLKSSGEHSFSFVTPSSRNQCLTVCGISPLCLSSKHSSRLSSLDRPFHKARRIDFLVCKEICALLELFLIIIM